MMVRESRDKVMPVAVHSKFGKSSPGPALLGAAPGWCVCGSPVPFPGEKALKWKNIKHMNELRHVSLQLWSSCPGVGLAGRADRTGGVGTLSEHLFPLEGITELRAPRVWSRSQGWAGHPRQIPSQSVTGAEHCSFSTFAKLEFALWPKYPHQHQYSISSQGCCIHSSPRAVWENQTLIKL